MLKVDHIHTYYGLSHVLFGVSLAVRAGEIVCLLGRNGAGKSTTMRSIMGLTPPREGEVVFQGRSCRGLPPFRRARLGMGYVPDDRRVFADLTVEENLLLGAAGGRPGPWHLDRVYEFFPALKKIDRRRAGFLSGGEQQMLTIARALMTNPDLLLLDEPTEGLAPLVVGQLQEQIGRLREEGLTVLLAEQNLQVALDLSDRGYLLDNGVIHFQGRSEEIRENRELQRRFLAV
ncbi:MAG: ABC transporter ATP-binding protein [Deltaproteobacteria bacterium]|nr:ABC transporter ATP-binding protein [Deltaproteobacteria bacterium]